MILTLLYIFIQVFFALYIADWAYARFFRRDLLADVRSAARAIARRFRR